MEDLLSKCRKLETKIAHFQNQAELTEDETELYELFTYVLAKYQQDITKLAAQASNWNEENQEDLKGEGGSEGSMIELAVQASTQTDITEPAAQASNRNDGNQEDSKGGQLDIEPMEISPVLSSSVSTHTSEQPRAKNIYEIIEESLARPILDLESDDDMDHNSETDSDSGVGYKEILASTLAFSLA